MLLIKQLTNKLNLKGTQNDIIKWATSRTSNRHFILNSTHKESSLSLEGVLHQRGLLGHLVSDLLGQVEVGRERSGEDSVEGIETR